MQRPSMKRPAASKRPAAATAAAAASTYTFHLEDCWDWRTVRGILKTDHRRGGPYKALKGPYKASKGLIRPLKELN